VLGTGQPITADRCSGYTDFDTVISVHRCPCDDNVNFTCLASDDDSCDSSASSVIWQTEPGIKYYIRVKGYGDLSFGKFALRVSTVEVPPNHVCSGAIEVNISESGDEADFGSTVSLIDRVPIPEIDSNNSTFPVCVSDTNAPGLWYSLQGTGQAFLLTTCHNETTVPAGISVFSGECDVLECIASELANDYACSGTGSRAIVKGEVGVNYFIFVHTGDDRGDFTLTVSPIDLASNDECTDALAVVPDSGIIYGNT